MLGLGLNPYDVLLKSQLANLKIGYMFQTLVTMLQHHGLPHPQIYEDYPYDLSIIAQKSHMLSKFFPSKRVQSELMK